MARTSSQTRSTHAPKLQKVETGIAGLDEILAGGIPKGRNTLVCGGAGSGKTMFVMEYLVRGAQQFNEPGVAMVFEETAEEITQNLSSLGYGVPRLIAEKKLLIDFVQIDRKEIEETGEYDLEPLLIRLDHAIKSTGAKRVAIDTLEVLFSGLQSESVVRAELRRMFRFLKDRGVSSIITAESGTGQLTRYGLEEYVADCVIMLDHRVSEQVSTRRLRVVKYRGSFHGTNEYPFLINKSGISVVPITSVGLTHTANSDRLSSGVPLLDEMLGGKGFYRGSSVLVTGTAGTGKSSFAARFLDAACQRGERSLYLAFEESPSQIQRNMKSVGLDLGKWLKKGLLEIVAERPTTMGLEAHLATIYQHVEKHQPVVLAMDPITNLVSIGDSGAVKAMLTRMIDYLKLRSVTAMFTNLNMAGMTDETSIGISSLMDTWIVLRDKELDGDRKRLVAVLKSRGMSHSSKTREFTLDENGINLAPSQLEGRMQ